MKFQINGCCFRITFELFWLGAEPLFKPYRLTGADASLRRKLFREVRARLRE